MSIIDKIKQRREQNLIKKIIDGKATIKEIVAGFERSNNKQNFIHYCYYDRLEDEEKNALKEKVQELCKNDKSFIFNELSGFIGNILSHDDAKEIMESNNLKPEEIISNIQLFSCFGYGNDKVKLLQGINPKLITTELLSTLDEQNRKGFISTLNIENVTQEMINILNDDNKISLLQKYIVDDSISPETIKSLFSEDILVSGVKNIVIKDATQLNDKCMQLITNEKNSEIVALAKMNYVLQNTKDSNEDISGPLQEVMSDNNFRKYFEYRQKNFNTRENEQKTNIRSSANIKTVLEVMSAVNEYKNYSDLINETLNSDRINDEKIKLLLKYYISDEFKTKDITSIDELLQYPENVLQRQIEEISSGDTEVCKNIIARNLTGFSLEEYRTYSSMFLESHDIEDVLKANNGNEQKITNINIMREIINLMEIMDDAQLQEFATNIANRNYNELVSGEFSLVALRENYKTFMSNIKSEYGKEFNQALGYDIRDTETVQIYGKSVDVHDISGEFKFLLHRTRDNQINHSKYADGKTCMSFISEGHYEVFGGDSVKSNSDVVFFIFDNLPEDLLYASSNSNMTSNRYGDTRSNFMTAGDTILKADKDIEISEGEDASKFTEQDYYFEGFDKNGKFVRIYPKAIGTFEKEPSEKTLKVAASYGVDVIKIPDMQTNLQNMLENGQVTPGLIKGINGNYDRVIEILSAKKSLSKEEKLSLTLLQQRESNETLSNQIEALLKKPTSKGKSEIGELVDDINITQINAISNETRQVINMINNPEISRGE